MYWFMLLLLSDGCGSLALLDSGAYLFLNRQLIKTSDYIKGKMKYNDKNNGYFKSDIFKSTNIRHVVRKYRGL